jgi:hypothetical protein
VKNKTLTIMMSVLAGMTALPMHAMPVFAESTEIRNTTEDGSSFVGDWSCGASGSKTMTINADGTYTAKNGDKEESGKWKMQNGDLMLDNGTTDATRCTLDGDMINAYTDGSVSVYRKGGVMKQTEKESKEEYKAVDDEALTKALLAGLADDEDSKSTAEVVEAKEENVVGDWYMLFFGMTLKMTFNEDGTAAISMGNSESDDSGKWEIKDGKVVVSGTKEEKDAETDESADKTSEGDEAWVFEYHDDDTMTASIEGMNITASKDAKAIGATEPAEVKEDATEEDFYGVWKADEMDGLFGTTTSVEKSGKGKDFINIKEDGTAEATLVTDKRTTEVKDIQTTFADGKLEFDITSEQIQDYLKDEMDMTFDSSTMGEGVTMIDADTSDEEEEDKYPDNDGISHAVLTVLADGRLKCDFTEHAKTKNSSIKTSFVMYLTKVTEDDVEAAKNSAGNENTKEAKKEAEPEAEAEGNVNAEDAEAEE